MNWIAGALIGGALLLPPFLAGDFYINLASQILIAGSLRSVSICWSASAG